MKLFGALHALASEQDCFLCGCAAPQAVCADCIAAMPGRPQAACPRCGLPAAHGGECGRCLSDPPHFDATVAAFAYGDPLDHALQAYKYRHALGLTRFLAARLDEAIGVVPRTGLVSAAHAAHVDLIVPMPLAPSRLSERGFNQALELARPIAKRRHIRLDARAVRRVRNTPPQAQLPWKERARNIKGAFECVARLDGLRVAVVDDVMTTGATLNELARALKAGGAVQVTNWVIARTLPRASDRRHAPASE